MFSTTQTLLLNFVKERVELLDKNWDIGYI